MIQKSFVNFFSPIWIKRLNIRASPLSSTTVSTLLFLEDSWNVNDGSIENIRFSPSPSAFSFISGEACWSYIFWMQMHYGYRTRGGKTRENETARNYGRGILFRWPASSYAGHFAAIALRRIRSSRLWYCVAYLIGREWEEFNDFSVLRSELTSFGKENIGNALLISSY